MIYHVQSIKFNIRTATVGGGGGGINKNGIVTLRKIRRLPRGGTVLISTVIKRASGARARPYTHFQWTEDGQGFQIQYLTLDT